jgi:hypothetical protein
MKLCGGVFLKNADRRLLTVRFGRWRRKDLPAGGVPFSLHTAACVRNVLGSNRHYQTGRSIKVLDEDSSG